MHHDLRGDELLHEGEMSQASEILPCELGEGAAEGRLAGNFLHAAELA